VVGSRVSALANHPLTPSLTKEGNHTRSIFMQSGEPKHREICARNDTFVMSKAPPPNKHVCAGSQRPMVEWPQADGVIPPFGRCE
jgi:hypothetical protein